MYRMDQTSMSGESRPSRARGLKPGGAARRAPGADRVAPFTGAWIETTSDIHVRAHHRVAPFTGAWIETCISRWCRSARASRPSRARGLKRITTAGRAELERVAPFTGAWIETL